MERVREISLYIVIGFVISFIAEITSSPFLEKFFKENLIELLIIIFSIDITVIAWNAAKIKEMAGEQLQHFTPVIHELKVSVIGQIAVIFLSLIILILYESKECSSFSYAQLFYNTLLASGLVYHIDVLRDTSNAIFALLRVESEQ